MASPNVYPAGYGGTSGVGLSTRSPILCSGVAYYVSSTTGNAAYAGTDRTKPLATLASAISAASAGDTINILENHAEAVTVQIAVNKALRIRGEGSGTTRPRFTCNNAIIMMAITAQGAWIENLYFPASTAVPTAQVVFSGSNCRMTSCYLESGASDTTVGLRLDTGANSLLIKNTTFQAAGTSVTAQPAIGALVNNAISDLCLENVTFNGGNYGYSDYAFKGSGAVTRVYGEDLQFLNGADWIFATGTSGEMHIVNKSGSVREVWTA